jgi:hypothetical protein
MPPAKKAARKAAASSRNKKKPSAREAFDANMADADTLLTVARLLRNNRRRGMRSELRQKVGGAIGVPKRRWDELACLENEEIFVAFKPGHASLLDNLNETALRPLLRQAVVAACAAVETFVADRVMEHYAKAMTLDPVPSRLLGLNMTVGDWLRIESTYKRKKWGLRNIVELEIREKSSPTPDVIGELFSMVGITQVFKKVDTARKVPSKTSAAQLDAIRLRRNKIAHEGDRTGRTRAPISIPEVERYLTQVREIVEALDKVTSP